MAAITRRVPYASILCPVDFSEHAGTALRYAAALARRAHGTLHVVFVNDPLLVAAAAAAYNTQTLGETSAGELRRFVRTAVPRQLLRGVTVRYETTIGKPAREILRLARTQAADLIVLGTKGLTAAERVLLGSTTTAVLRKTTVPVLAVPPLPAEERTSGPDKAWPGPEIIAPIALGPQAAADMARTADVARLFGVAIRFVHAVPPASAPAWLHAEADAHLRIRTAKAATVLERLRRALDGVHTTIDVRAGSPPDEIAAIAAEHRTGLIVMSLRGREGWFGDAAGAVTYHVLCHAVAPVLALPVQRAPARRR